MLANEANALLGIMLPHMIENHETLNFDDLGRFGIMFETVEALQRWGFDNELMQDINTLFALSEHKF